MLGTAGTENGMKENSEIKEIPFKSKQLYLSEWERVPALLSMTKAHYFNSIDNDVVDVLSECYAISWMEAITIARVINN